MNEDYTAAPDPATPPVTASEQAWKILQLINEWVRHAETKLAATLAAAGISGGVLFSLIQNRQETSGYFSAAAIICCAAAILSGASAMVGLYPVLGIRVPDRDGEADLMFFGDIKRFHRHDAHGYLEALRALTSTPDELVRHLGRQIHANSVIAGRKFRWANLAIRALLIDLLALGTLMLLIALGL